MMTVWFKRENFSSLGASRTMMMMGEEASVRAAFDARRAALKEKELLEITSLRIRHATEVERLQHRICTAALGVKGQEQARFITPTKFEKSPFLVHKTTTKIKLGTYIKLSLRVGGAVACRTLSRRCPPRSKR